MYDNFPDMTLFLLAGIPFFCAFFLVFACSNAFDPKMVLREAGKGMLGFFPVLILHFIAEIFFPAAAHEGKALYFSRTLLDLVLPLLFSSAAYFVIYRREIILPGDYQFLRFFSFETGMFSFFAFYCFLSFNGWYDGYEYLLLPLLWIILILSTGFAFGFFFSQNGFPRFLLLVFALALPFGLGWIPYLYITSHYFFSWSLTILAFGGAFFLFWKGLEQLK